MRGFTTIILAAGKGTRMKSGLVKVLHPVMGRPMLSYPLDVCARLGSKKTVIVVGHQAERVREAFSERGLTFVVQEPQLGSGHAALATEGAFRDYEGTILILSGDVPLIQAETLKEFLSFHHGKGSTLTVATTRLSNPTGYGRVIRRHGSAIERIVEEKDASPDERSVDEINTGLYCVEAPFLFSALKRVKADNEQGEYYLTDIVHIGCEDNETVMAFELPDPEEFTGINTRADLARCHEVVRKRCIQRLMLDGVTVVAPDTAHIESDVTIGEDTLIYPNCVIQGRTVIGRRCVIGPNCLITNSRIGDEVTVRGFSSIEESRIEREAIVGPFARIRPQSRILEGARIGNFVEVKKSVIGKGSKANHLAYVGDATLGEGVNIGAGTIFCNYDGVEKHPTVLGDGVFVGSNTELVAPLNIGDRAVIGAGSTITSDVPEDSLAVSRVKQKNVEGWAKRKRRKNHTRSSVKSRR
jgi:bifunctional UDP-N-acetylglucosamine pyrophosphorylase/glucosamine-1-phosphate N-acetyltransferase